MAEISSIGSVSSQAGMTAPASAVNEAPPPETQTEPPAQPPSNVNQQPTEVLASLGIGQNINVQA